MFDWFDKKLFVLLKLLLLFYVLTFNVLNKGFAIKNIIKNKIVTNKPNLKKLPNGYNGELSIGVMICKKAIAPRATILSEINTSKTLFNGSSNLLFNLSYLLKIRS